MNRRYRIMFERSTVCSFIVEAASEDAAIEIAGAELGKPSVQQPHFESSGTTKWDLHQVEDLTGSGE